MKLANNCLMSCWSELGIWRAGNRQTGHWQHARKHIGVLLRLRPCSSAAKVPWFRVYGFKFKPVVLNPNLLNPKTLCLKPRQNQWTQGLQAAIRLGYALHWPRGESSHGLHVHYDTGLHEHYRYDNEFNHSTAGQGCVRRNASA